MVGSEHLGRGIHALMLVEESAHIACKLSVVGLPGGVQRSGGLFIGTAYLAPTDRAGNLLKYKLEVPGLYTNYYTYTYAKYDSYKEDVVSGKSDVLAPGLTDSNYDVNGNLLSVRGLNFITNQQGEILRKQDPAGYVNDYFYVNGKPMGNVTSDVRLSSQTPTPVATGNFDFSYSPISDRSG